MSKVSKSQASQQGKALDVDGWPWTAKQRDELDELAVATFGRGAGKQFLDYLKSITLGSVSGPEASTEYLRHIEGQRFIVQVCDARCERGREKRKKA